MGFQLTFKGLRCIGFQITFHEQLYWVSIKLPVIKLCMLYESLNKPSMDFAVWDFNKPSMDFGV